MLIQFDTATHNAMLDAIEASIGPSPTLRIRTGTIPANPLAARTGTVLATIPLPTNWLLDAAGASKAQSGTWADNMADAQGLATYFDITDAAGVVRWQGDVGKAGENAANASPAFLIVDNTNFATGQAFNISAFVINSPAANR